jgi:hypothetical protein
MQFLTWCVMNLSTVLSESWENLRLCAVVICNQINLHYRVFNSENYVKSDKCHVCRNDENKFISCVVKVYVTHDSKM